MLALSRKLKTREGLLQMESYLQIYNAPFMINTPNPLIICSLTVILICNIFTNCSLGLESTSTPTPCKN